MRLRSPYGLYLRTVVDERDGSWVRRYMGAAVDGGLWLWMRIWIVSGIVGYIESIRMVFQRSECSSYRCDGSFRKLCSATCICAFTTLPMVAAHVPTLCTLSATCLRFPRRCCFCVRSQRCSRRVRVQHQRKSGVREGRVTLLTLLKRAFFFRDALHQPNSSPASPSRLIAR
jgi:hypothetical protein